VQNIDHVYDYVGFQPGLPDWITFNPCKILPKGKDCRCIDFLHTGTLDNIGSCSNESKAGLRAFLPLPTCCSLACLVVHVFFCHGFGFQQFGLA
jgi:hypothetical protein